MGKLVCQLNLWRMELFMYMKFAKAYQAAKAEVTAGRDIAAPFVSESPQWAPYSPAMNQIGHKNRDFCFVTLP
jgi:hypothetical protein